MTKPMSAAEYRANAEQKRAARPTEIVELKSGSVFELRRPDLNAYMITGRLPQSLVREGLKAWKTKIPADKIANELGDEEMVDSLVFMRELVHECTVTPKFVEFATNDNEISAADMLIEDFNEIFSWAMGHQGVKGMAGLETFREGPERGTSNARAHSKKRRSKNKQSVEHAGAVRRSHSARF